MTLANFENLINTLTKDLHKARELYKLGVDIDNDEMLKVVEMLITEVFGTEKHEMISWFVYENDGGKGNLKATKDGESICYDIKSLYEYVSGK